nr:DUF3310 domain-containing protein [Mammaliicoccus lentus]
MKFKEGDRVHVLRWKDNDVNFYTTLAYANYPGFYHMSDSSDSYYNELTLLKEYSHYFGKKDYYILAEDEEDTEEPVIQHTTDPVNHPDHYNYGEIEIIDFIEQVSEHYNPVVAVHIANAIKYLSRAPHKNGKEDIEKARWYIERAYQKWSD